MFNPLKPKQKVSLLPVNPTDPKKMFKFADTKLFISYIIACKAILEKNLNHLTFINRNIIPVSTRFMWTTTQLRRRL